MDLNIPEVIAKPTAPYVHVLPNKIATCIINIKNKTKRFTNLKYLAFRITNILHLMGIHIDINNPRDCYMPMAPYIAKEMRTFILDLSSIHFAPSPISWHEKFHHGCPFALIAYATWQVWWWWQRCYRSLNLRICMMVVAALLQYAYNKGIWWR